MWDSRCLRTRTTEMRQKNPYSRPSRIREDHRRTRDDDATRYSHPHPGSESHTRRTMESQYRENPSSLSITEKSPHRTPQKQNLLTSLICPHLRMIPDSMPSSRQSLLLQNSNESSPKTGNEIPWKHLKNPSSICKTESRKPQASWSLSILNSQTLFPKKVDHRSETEVRREILSHELRQKHEIHEIRMSFLFSMTERDPPSEDDKW